MRSESPSASAGLVVLVLGDDRSLRVRVVEDVRDACLGPLQPAGRPVLVGLLVLGGGGRLSGGLRRPRRSGRYGLGPGGSLRSRSRGGNGRGVRGLDDRRVRRLVRGDLDGLVGRQRVRVRRARERGGFARLEGGRERRLENNLLGRRYERRLGDDGLCRGCERRPDRRGLGDRGLQAGSGWATGSGVATGGAQAGSGSATARESEPAAPRHPLARRARREFPRHPPRRSSRGPAAG